MPVVDEREHRVKNICCYCYYLCPPLHPGLLAICSITVRRWTGKSLHIGLYKAQTQGILSLEVWGENVEW